MTLNGSSPSQITGGPQRNIVRIFQTHNASGAPEPVEYVQVVLHRTINTLGSDAMDLLRPLNPTQSAEAGSFFYNDPSRGSGWFRLEGFRPGDAHRIQELVRMEEITRAVGREPLRNPDLAFGNAMVLRTNNPWAMFGIAAVTVILGFACFTAVPPYASGFIAVVIVGALLILVGLAAAVFGAIRLPWWRRARRLARAQGGRPPSDLSGL